MFNAGVRGKRAKDSTGFITVGEHFNQQTFLVPTVTRFAVTDGSYVDTNDTAADTAGGQTIVLYGSGFAPGATVLVGSTTIGAVTFLDSGRLTFSSPALGSGSYTVFVTNANGGTGILVPGLVYSGVPTFTTAAGSLGSVYETTAISTTVVATGDAPITYALSSGSLPSGSTLSSSGTISGTAPVDGSSTTYSFTVQATDADNQDSVRSFSLTINTDVVSFSSPANNTTTTATQNTAISNVTVTATSAAGYGVLYTSSGLPTGLSMNTSTGIISGTPTVAASNTSIITATANTTSRTATRYLNWTINLPGDLFWKYAALLMSANTVPNGNTFNTDLSTFNNEVVVVADTKPNEFHPFKEGYYSNLFDGSGDYLAILTNAAFNIGTNSFTVEAWINTSSATQQSIFNISDTASSGYGAVRVQVLSNQTVQWLMGPGGSWGVAVTAGSITLGTWNHIAITRNGSSVYFFINGLQVGTTQTYATSLTTGGTTYIGYNSGTAFGFNGYISNFRFINGNALYTANTSPSTLPLTYVANTSLLTCQSNKLIDNSNNNFTISKAGDTTVSPFNPFNGTPTTITVPDANNYSVYFDGTGDYLDVTGTGNEFVFGTGDFTIELWVHPTIAPSANWNTILTLGSGGGSGGQEIRISQNMNGAGFGYLIPNNSNNSDVYTGFGTLTLNQWHHLALVRNGSTVTLYRNGVSVGSTTSVSFNFTNTTLYRIGGPQAAYSADGNFGGYVSSLRIVKGLPVYTGNFTVPTSPLSITQSSSANTSALAIVPTNGASVYFDGTGDYLTGPSNNSLITTGPFTIELWVWVPSNASGRSLLGNARWNIGQNGGFRVYLLSNGTVSLSASTGTYNTYPSVLVSTTTVTPKTWTHIAFVRDSSNTVSCYINGVSAATPVTYASSLSLSSDGNIGQFTVGTGIFDGSATDFFTGYISNLRLNAGTAVYTSAFTPPTEPLTAIANTKILICQSKTSTIIDSSTNAFTITKVGDAAVANTLGPFGTTASFLTAQANTVIDNSNNALTITTNGNAGPARNGPFANTTTVTLIGNEGSAYFDGTGDYLSMSATGNPLDWPASANYTIEAWVYLNAFTGTESSCILARRNPTATTTDWQFQISTSGALVFYNLNGGTTITASSNMVIKQWNHCAVVISAGTARLYLNGRLVSTPTAISAASTSSVSTYIVGASNSVYLNGYISNLRVVKGTALYTTPFVPTWAPLTPVANTVLLTAQTNLSSNTKVIVDESNLNSVVTVFGNTNLGSFSPFGSTWSGYFDGANDFLSIPTSSSFNFGTGDFTVECWVNWSSTTTDRGIISRYAGASSGWALRYDNTSGPTLNWINGDTSILIASHTPIAGTWYHYAVCRSGTTLRIFINGTQSASTTYSGNQDTSSTLYIGQLSNTLWPVNGYISNVRILKGTALYTAAFTPSTNPLLPVANTILLTCNSNRFVDYSAANNVITKGGDGASTVSKFSPFSSVTVTPASYSGYFDGTGDYLVTPINAGFDMGTGDFTVECFVINNGYSGSQYGRGLFAIYPGASYNQRFIVRLNSGYNLMNMYGWNGTTAYLGASGTNGTALLSNSTKWYHIAVVRQSGVFRLYVDGVQDIIVSNQTSQSLPTSCVIEIGRTQDGTVPDWNGYISNFRVVKGTAVYTAAFTPPTAPLTAIANTSLLTCQSTTFVDTSNNAFAITVNGNAKPVIQNPFTDTVSTASNYSANTFGNSVYFDGTADYLNVTPATALAFGTSDFTVEAWAYLPNVTSQQSIVYLNGNASGYAALNLQVQSGALNLWMSSTGSAWSLQQGTIGSISANTWTHIAVTKSSTTMKVYINGTQAGTNYSVASSLMATYTLNQIGVYNNSSYLLTGYLSNLRVVMGTALYTGPFIPSGQPLPVTSNTTLLLASTVGPSTTDATRNHNIETFGTARQVANNSPYYDTYSAYFDGTGDYLTFGANQANLGLGTGDFTFEFWFYATTIPSTEVDFFESQTTGSFRILKRASSSGLSYDWYGGTAYLIKSDATITTNEWHHVAVSRTSGTVSAYYDGTRVINQADSTSGVTPTANYGVGGRASGANYFTGNISNMRLIKGTGLYSGTTITVPTSPLTAVANTQLLICNNNRFIDGSTNAFTITKAGDAKITAFEPFDSSNNSRFNSIYFGTKTDYLAIRQQANLKVFPGDFTFECWVYPTDTTLSTAWSIWDARQTGASAAAMTFGLGALASPVTGSWRMAYFNGTNYYGTGTILWNQWTHVAWVRSGTTMTFYVNGVASGTATVSGTQTATVTTNPIYIGTKDNGLAGYGTVGYIADLRITNGYARTITVPTAPYDIK